VIAIATVALIVLLVAAVALKAWQAVLLCSAGLLAIVGSALGLESAVEAKGKWPRLLLELTFLAVVNIGMILLLPRITVSVVIVDVFVIVGYVWWRWRSRY
jgi:hypothetical protein